MTINDINILEEMNTAQIHNNNTNEEAIENNRGWTTVANNNRYNLRPRPVNRGNMYTLLQDNQQSAHVAIPKPHSHVMGMTLDYSTKGKVKISMYDYIDKLLTELPSDMNGSARTPAASHLFNVNKDAKKLQEESAQLFHHLVAKLLYLSRRTRQDIQTAVAFLCTRVQSLDEDDYKKLTRVMQYLWAHNDITLTLEPEEQPNWWVDSSYAVHPDMRSHSSIIM